MKIKSKDQRYKSKRMRVRLFRCLTLILFAVLLIFKTTIFAKPNTIYDLNRNGHYFVMITNSLTRESAKYAVQIYIEENAYSDNQYKVSYATTCEKGDNVFNINWQLDPCTYQDWYADKWVDGVYYPANTRQYIFHNGITLNKDGYHISLAQPGDTQSVIEGRLGDNGAWWSIDTNATGHTNQRNLGEKHDTLKLSYDPDTFHLNFDYAGGN